MNDVNHSIYGAGYIVRSLLNDYLLIKFQDYLMPKVVPTKELSLA